MEPRQNIKINRLYTVKNIFYCIQSTVYTTGYGHIPGGGGGGGEGRWGDGGWMGGGGGKTQTKIYIKIPRKR